MGRLKERGRLMAYVNPDLNNVDLRGKFFDTLMLAAPVVAGFAFAVWIVWGQA